MDDDKIYVLIAPDGDQEWRAFEGIFKTKNAMLEYVKKRSHPNIKSIRINEERNEIIATCVRTWDSSEYDWTVNLYEEFKLEELK